MFLRLTICFKRAVLAQYEPRNPVRLDVTLIEQGADRWGIKTSKDAGTRLDAANTIEGATLAAVEPRLARISAVAPRTEYRLRSCRNVRSEPYLVAILREAYRQVPRDLQVSYFYCVRHSETCRVDRWLRRSLSSRSRQERLTGGFAGGVIHHDAYC